MSSSIPGKKNIVSAEETEQLSAFMDNELDNAATQQITSALTQRTEMRTEANSLRRTWELLDYLPQPTVPTSFTEQTMTRLESTKGILLRQGIKWKRFAIAGWAACLIVAALAGFIITYYWNQEQEDNSVTVSDVIPTETHPISTDASSAVAQKIKRDREKAALKPWQIEAVQRNEKLRKELARIVLELQPRLKPQDRRRLAAAAKEGGLGYVILVIDLARQYQVPLPDSLSATPGSESQPNKKPNASKPATD
jgi:hypothetical protein